MGRDLLESQPRDLLDAMSPSDNSIYARGGKFDQAKRFGVLSKGPKILGVPVAERAMSGVLGGIPAMVGGATNVEDTAPMTGQAIGGYLGDIVNPVVGGIGGTVGATTGQAIKQGVKGIRGYKPNLGEIPLEAARTAVGETVGRAIPRVLFPNQFGGKARQLAGEEVGNIAKQVQENAPFIRISKKDIQEQLGKSLEDAPFESGPQRSQVIKVKNRLESLGSPLTFDEARQLEQELGRRAKFAQGATEEGPFQKGPPAPLANQALKEARSRVSAKVDEAAFLAGFPEFETASKKYSNLMKKYPEKKLMAMYGQPGIWGRGAAGAGALAIEGKTRGKNPEANAMAAVLGWYALPPRYRTAMFRNVVDKPIGRSVGRALTLGGTEMLRPSDENQ